MARRKKGTITYDSKETMVFLGLVILILGIFFLISLFTISEGEQNLFTQAKQIFGNATIFVSGFFILLGLKFLGAPFGALKFYNFFGAALLIPLISGLLTAFDGKPSEIIKLDGGQTSGGFVGYQVVFNIFGDKIPTEPATKIILTLLVLLILPVALAISPSKIVAFISAVFTKIWAVVNYLFIDGGEETDEEIEEEETAGQIKKAERLGDFNNLISRRKDAPPAQVEKKTAEEDEEDLQYHKQFLQPKANANNENAVVKFSGDKKVEDGLYQTELNYPNWKLPPLSLLIPFKKVNSKEATINQNARIIEQILESFRIEAKVEEAFVGPSVVLYALNIPLGINVKKIATLSENLALALGVDSKAVRIDSIPETTYLGIEVPRSQRDMVRVKEIMSADTMVDTKASLPIPIGKDINGDPVVGDIQKMPHLLIAGATGSGKSVLTNGFITSLIMKKTPDELKLILVDPKQVEFIDYNGIPHLLHPVITDMELVVKALKWSVAEMERRYTLLAKNQVRNIEGYNTKMGFAAMPYIVIVIDEMADMMMTANKVEAENAIVRLAQKARAVGVHLILATQRPSVNVITGIIKANIPGRIAMSVTSSTDSRVILDRIGAESLMGKGDLLYKAPDKTKSIRLQCPNIEQDEVIKVVEFAKSQEPDYEYPLNFADVKLDSEMKNGDMGMMGDVSGDNLFEQAIRIVVESKKGSSSYLQRRLNIGFNRAARLLEELEESGVVGPTNGSKPREVLIGDAEDFIAQMKGL